VVLLVKAADMCDEGEDIFPYFGGEILEANSISNNFTNYDLTAFSSRIYIYSLYENSEIELDRDFSVDIRFCYVSNNDSRILQVTELLLSKSYEVLNSSSSSIQIQNEMCVPRMMAMRQNQICCSNLTINPDWIKIIANDNKDFGINVKSPGVRALIVRNTQVKVKNCRVTNAPSISQDLVIDSEDCIVDQSPLIQFLFQNACIIFGTLTK